MVYSSPNKESFILSDSFQKTHKPENVWALWLLGFTTRQGIRQETLWLDNRFVGTREVGALEDSVSLRASRGFAERFARENVPRRWF